MQATMKSQESPATRVIKYRLAGEVQGVGFRNFIKSNAQEFDLSGFVSNEADGGLVVLLIGDDEQIGKMYSLLHQGPPNARVVTVTEIQPEEDDTQFARTVQSDQSAADFTIRFR